MADMFTHNAPDYDPNDMGQLLGPAGTSIADRLRRMALAMSLQAKTFSQDPLHTLFPWVGPTGATGGRTVGAAKNVGGDWSALAGQYVGPNDMRAHKLIPGYIPRQDWQNAIQADPLAGMLGPMQKPAPKQPEPTSGF
jgi:hypothetical protein